ncbi:MAG: lysophospholipid acyltransferase family protein [Gammaproteobacteria bacterium]|nr:lysophospholipid acyltransferase family protein [Gammaproteobacteria bacterium]
MPDTGNSWPEHQETKSPETFQIFHMSKSDNQGQITPGMFRPAFWPTWSALFCLWLLMRLPRVWLMRVGGWLGDWLRHRNHKRRHIARINLELCFPDISDRHREQLLIEHFRYQARGLIDLGLACMGSRQQLARYHEIQGIEHITGNLGDSGVIVIGFHSISMEMAAASLLSDIPLVSMMKRDSNPVINRFLYRSRTRFRKAEVYMRDQGLRGIVRGVRQGKACYLVPDEDYGDSSHTVFAPFFGEPKSTLTTVSRLAIKTGALVVACFCILDGKTGNYKSVIRQPLGDFSKHDEVENAKRINQAAEELIRLAPEQYMWTFKLFRTRPNGGADPYRQS